MKYRPIKSIRQTNALDKPIGSGDPIKMWAILAVISHQNATISN